MTFDDADEKMTRDEIEYMLTNSEETLDADEIEMLQGIFSLDEINGQRSHGSSDGCLHGRYSG